MFKQFYEDLPSGRCQKCKYAKAVNAAGGFIFLGCFYNKLKGKWVAEIKNCPMVEEVRK